MARRMMWHAHHGCHHGPEDRLELLERYQRDLEQEVADVAERIRRIKEADAPADA